MQCKVSDTPYIIAVGRRSFLGMHEFDFTQIRSLLPKIHLNLNQFAQI